MVSSWVLWFLHSSRIIGISIDIDIGINIRIGIGIGIRIGIWHRPTRLLYRLQMCLVIGIGIDIGIILHVCFRCVWSLASAYTSALHIADVFGCMVTRLLYRLQMCFDFGSGLYASVWIASD
ncbi:hypothetical protein Tco_0517075 [Tanacetum coccineum]